MVTLTDFHIILYHQTVKPTQAKARKLGYEEILLRVASPNGEVSLPKKFLDLASTIHARPALDRQIIKLLLAYLAESGDMRAFGVNLSAETIAQNGDFFMWLESTIRAEGLSPEQFVFEINEDTAATDRQSVIDAIHHLEQFGCRIALDDFGSGRLNAWDVDKLKPDYLKIDGRYIASLDNQRSSSSVRYFIELAQIDSALTVAEGVQSPEQFLNLQKLGVDLMQGFLIHKPAYLYSPCPRVFLEV